MLIFLNAAARLRIRLSSKVCGSGVVKTTGLGLDLAADPKRIAVPGFPIFQVPPLHPTEAVAHLFDAFILVVEWGSTSTDEILKAIGSSPVLSDRLLGAVLNKADEAVMRRYEGYSDRRHTYYANPHTLSGLSPGMIHDVAAHALVFDRGD